MLKDIWKKYSIVIILCFIVAVLSMLHVILGYSKTPQGMVYLWTGHYYLDFFEYVQAIAQGMRGNWLWENYFTTDDSRRLVFGIWQYLILGKIGGLFRLSPIAAYWFFVFLFSMFFAILIFVAIRKLLAGEPFSKSVFTFILSLFAAPFFNIILDKGGLQWIIYGFWNDKSVFWKRFGPVPHHLLANIVSLGILLIFSHSVSDVEKDRPPVFIAKIFGIALLIIYLLLFSPANAVLIFIAILLTSSVLCLQAMITKNKREFTNFFLGACSLFAIIVPAGFFIQKQLIGKYYADVSKFETTWQVHPPVLQVILTFGPIIIFAIFGIFKLKKKLSALWLLFFSLTLVSGVFFFSSLAAKLGTTNTRFLTPLTYVFLAVLFGKAVNKLKNFVLLSVLLFILFIPANVRSFQLMLEDKNLNSPITYLPKGIILGYRFLATQPGTDSVLVTPSQFLGSVLPIFANRHVYVARHNTTPDYINKNIRTNNFYLGGMTDREAGDFLKKNGLKFVVLTSIEGYDVKKLYEYPFLEEIYKNKDIVIFKF